MGPGKWVLLGIAVWLAITMIRGYRRAGKPAPYICPSCGSRGYPETRTRGSLLLEVVLWLCFIVPGLIYSVWRLTARDTVCPTCGQPGMVPVNTPRGQELVSHFAPRRSA